MHSGFPGTQHRGPDVTTGSSIHIVARNTQGESILVCRNRLAPRWRGGRGGGPQVLKAVSEGLTALLLDRGDGRVPMIRSIARELLATAVLRNLMFFFTPYTLNKVRAPPCARAQAWCLHVGAFLCVHHVSLRQCSPMSDFSIIHIDAALRSGHKSMYLKIVPPHVWVRHAVPASDWQDASEICSMHSGKLNLDLLQAGFRCIGQPHVDVQC